MAKNKKKTVLKQSKHDIANYGVGGSKLAATGTSSSSFTGATWSKVDHGKAVIADLMKNQENYRNTVDTKKLRKQCTDSGGLWNPITGTCDEGKGKKKEEIIPPKKEEIIPPKKEEIIPPKKEELEKEEPVKEEEIPPVSDDDDKDGEKTISEELESGKYEVKTSTKISLKELFKNGKLRKADYQHDDDTRNRMRGEINDLKRKYKKKGKWTDEDKSGFSAKKAEWEKLKSEVHRKNIKVKIPGKRGWQTMTVEEFEENYADKLNLKTKGGRSFGENPSRRGGRDYYSENKPVQFRSPFARRDTSNKNLRKNWKLTPMNYNSPFHEEVQEGQQGVQGQQFGSIWEKIEAYGTDMPEKVDKFIQHTSYDPETDKPINSFQNQEWVKAITLWCQDQKSSMVKARNSKNNDEQQRIAAAVNTLIQDVTTYSGKFMDWIARNSGDQAEGNTGGSVVSEGSKKDERFIGNTTFMGDVNMVAAVGEDGKLGIKAYGLDEVKYVEELDSDVFAKDDVGFLQFTKIAEQLQKDAESGKPLNENVVKGNADQLLKNKDSILSWAFDPLYGQSWLQDFSEGNPNMNLDAFMPESPEFDIDYLTDELHGWLTSKLTESYNQNVPQQPEKKGDAAQGIMDETLAGVEEEKKNKEGVYTEGGGEEGQPQEEMMAQGPPPQEQGSPMGYKGKKSKAVVEILRRYNRYNRR